MSTKNVLIIFTRNPELGKCKTRLAATVGDASALEIYKFLLAHTVSITKNLELKKQVWYSVKVREGDIWNAGVYEKYKQEGDDLGERMDNAFAKAFKQGHSKAIIIGSDMYDLSQADIELAFEKLNAHDVVLGPATDGGYYLLGMKKPHPALFQNKAWGTETVQAATLADLTTEKVTLLEPRNDVDYYEDIKDIRAFEPFLPKNLING